MTDATLSPIKRAFLALEDAQARLAAAEAAARAPIAVIGLGCRVPGAHDPAAFWELLRDGRDAVGPIPRERFDIDAYFNPDADVPGGVSVREAGFIDGPVDGFDAAFFGISPREARGMDPQQRLLLEVAWEALEHAGVAPDRLSTSATGVYIGQCSSDYAELLSGSGDAALLDAHFASGIAHSVSSGRISYLLGLQGPSLTVDTACSSSLAAVHLACQALRSGECRMALSGGVNLMLSAQSFIAFSHSRMLAPDGRCKSFDASADGFGRGEGCGVVVLKRLADAQADGDRILAVIRGSAVNQDGPSSGLTAPNGPAQEAVIRAALAMAGVAPADIGVIEAHGTGTQLGDPLEVQALGQVFGPGRDGVAPLWLASVKANIGHLEAAAGVIGLIKLVLALQHRFVPAHLHFRAPSPHIAWGELPLRVPTTMQPWQPIGGRRLAGVSSFGFSGTNVHVVVEQAPQADAPSAAGDEPPQLFTLSARDDAALRMLARQHGRALEAKPGVSLAALCRTAATGRARFAHRATVLAHSIDGLRTTLAALADAGAGADAPGLRVATLPRRDPPRIAFAFTGQGSQYAGMARGLYDAEPVFRAALDRCAQAMHGKLTHPLTELLFASDPAMLDRTEHTQPALFAIEFALAELWRHWGVVPAMVIGHSVGEVVAACVAGVMTLDAAAALVCERARLMGALPPGGAMAAVQATAETLAPHLAAFPQLAVAALNSPTQTVVSGDAAQLDALCLACSAHGLRCQRLAVSHAFHSPRVEPMLDAFEALVRGIPLAAPRLRLVSNVSGALATASEVTQAHYWRRHVREPVRFADGVATLVAQKAEVCVEIGPQPALAAFIAAGAPGLVTLPTLRKGRPDREQMLDALAMLFLEGAQIDWHAVFAQVKEPPVALPTYPFQRERCWFVARPAPAAPRHPSGVHVLLGRRVRSAAAQRIHESRLCADAPAYIAQHRVQGQVVLPATVTLEMLLAAAGEQLGPRAHTLDEVTLQGAMLLPDEPGAGRTVQVLVEPPREGVCEARLCSIADDADVGSAWTCHVSARWSVHDSWLAADAGPTLAQARAACAELVNRDAFYARLADAGLAFGPVFHSVQQLWRGPGQALGEVCLHAELAHERAACRFHPVLLDGCIQLVAEALNGDAGAGLFLPFSIGRYRLLGVPGERCWAHVSAAPGQQGEIRRAELRVFDADGRLIAELHDLRLKRVAPAALGRLGERGVDELLYDVAWRDAPATAADAAIPVADLAIAARSALEALRSSVGLAAYDACLPRLERLCADYIAAALLQLGWAASPGERAEGAVLAARLGVAPRHHALLARLLAILAEQRWLVRDGTDWQVQRAFADAQPARDAAAFSAEHTPIAAELELCMRTGGALAAALRGDADPLELLFPGGATQTAERIYRDSPPAQLFNRLIAEAVATAAAVATRGGATGRPLRILEIGAGTGGTTAHLLPRLASLQAGSAHDPCTYAYTDIGAAFVARGRERFGSHTFMQFQVFDLEQDASAQGLIEQGYDLILASNVVHATRDLRRSLGRVRRLLAPGGVLLMLEACAPQAWFDLTVGLTEGWWLFTDHALRPDYPTLPRDAWLRLLGEAGFGAVEAVGGERGERGDPGESGAMALNTLLFAQAAEASGDWLVLADAGGLGAALAARLESRGQACVLVTAGSAYARSDAGAVIDPHDPEHSTRLWRELRAEGRRWLGVIHAGTLDEPAASAAKAEPSAALLGALHIAQALVAHGAPPRLWLLTGAAQAGTGAALCGLARTLRLEHPELGAVCIELDHGAGPGDVDAVLAELDRVDGEPERRLRGMTRQVARLQRLPRESLPADAGASWRLEPALPGSLDALIRTPRPRTPPGPGEVEIAVEVTGLNFKDVLNVLGLYPGDPGPLGGECAGRISALGVGVTQFAVGDAVLALAAGSFASHVCVSAAFVQPRPDDISAEEAAAFSIAYLTAQFCLGHLAEVQAGQRVLIHAAAGGVGIAAVRIAQRAGAEVYATAGSAWKRELLLAMGVAAVFDSRSAAFADALLARTGGRGVHVVLNSLSGELIEPSFAALADGGCFVEIGKRDIKSATEVESLGRGIRYHVVDWGATAAREPALIAAMYARLVDGLRDGSLAPLPRQVFALDDAAQAFRFMAQARHAGRIVVRHPGAAPWCPSRRGSYLVTGGLSGLGLQVAAWLAERGAGRLVLIGRRGVTSEAAPLLERLRAQGVAVIAEAIDVADEVALRGLLDRVRSDGPPLRGIWHSAGVLDDAALLQQDAQRYTRVFAPKVHGAQLLDRLTRSDALDAFVLFGSVAGVLGAAGQSNHAAASACLAALAHDRAARALPALAIDWGAWRDVGAAADRGIGDRLAAQGVTGFAPAQGLRAMERLLERRCTQAAVLAIDWPTYLARVVPGGHSALLAELAAPPAGPASAVPAAPSAKVATADQLRQLTDAPESRRRALLAAFVRERALRALGLDAARPIDPRTPLGELGLDSLLAVELRNTLGSALGRSLPATLLFDHPTLDSLTDFLLADIFVTVGTSATSVIDTAQTTQAASAKMLGLIEDLSDEEVERQLAARHRPRD